MPVIYITFTSAESIPRFGFGMNEAQVNPRRSWKPDQHLCAKLHYCMTRSFGWPFADRMERNANA